MNKIIKKFTKAFFSEKKNIEGLVILCYCILFYFNLIMINRLKMFFFIIFIIGTYLIIIKYIKNHLKDYLEMSYNKNEDKKKFMNKLQKVFKIILNFFLYKSIVGYLLLLQRKLFSFFRRINYIFLNYEIISKFIYYSIIVLIIDPIKIMHLYYYNFLEKLIKKTILEIFLRRFISLFISIILLTPIINYIIYLLNGKWIILFYLLFLFLSLCIHFNFIIYTPEDYTIGQKRDFNEYQKFKDSLTNDKSILNLNELKLETTILGNFISVIVKFIEKKKERIDISENKGFFLRKIHLDFGFVNRLNIKDYCKLRLLTRCIISVEYYESMSTEIKNRLYVNLHHSIYFYSNHICCGIYSIDKFKDNKKKVEELTKVCLLEKRILKNIFFILWDIERYVGIKSNNLYIQSGQYYNDFSFFNPTKNKDGKKNENKCLDIEDDFEKILNIYCQIELLSFYRIEGMRGVELIEDYFKIGDIHITDLVEYEVDEVTGGQLKIKDETKLLEYMEKMADEAALGREQGEKEGEEGKRTYIGEEKEIICEYKWEDIK